MHTQTLPSRCDLKATGCGSHARAEKTLGGGDPPFEIFSGDSSPASYAAARHGAHCAADVAHVLG